MSDWRELVRRPLRGEAAYHVPAHPGAIKLDANESPFRLSEAALADVAEALRAPELHRYPDAGASALRAQLAARVGVAPDELSLANGSDETLGLLVAAFGEPRDARGARVAYPWPGFVVYRTVTLSHGLEPVEIPFGPGFTADAGALFAAIAHTQPNVVFLATPNNPTGTEWAPEVIRRLVEQHPEVLVVVDEAYLAYSGRPSLVPLALAHPNCVVVQTLSKIGLAGLRVGYAVGRREVIAELEKVRAPYNLDTLSQRAATVILARHGAELDAQARLIAAERERVAAGLRAAGLEVFPSGANFVLARSKEASAIHARLAARGVLVRNFDRPGPLAGCLRVTMGTPAENDALLAALAP